MNVFPLSFAEFLEFNHMSVQNLNGIMLVSRATQIKALLYDYLESAYLLFFLKRFSFAVREQKKIRVKYIQ